MDNKKIFVEQLRKTAKVLEPFINEGNPKKRFVMRALLWWSKLMNTSYLLEHQDTSLTPGQIEYLRTSIFGTMGSFQDFSFGIEDLGEETQRVNDQLRKQTGILFESFRKLKPQ